MRYMVLSDGETYTQLDGCFVLDVPDGTDGEQIETILHEEFYENYDITQSPIILRVYRYLT